MGNNEVVEEVLSKEKEKIVSTLEEVSSEVESNEVVEEVLIKETKEKEKIDIIASTSEELSSEATKEKELNPFVSTLVPKGIQNPESTEEMKVLEFKEDIYGIFTLVIPVDSNIGDHQKFMDDVEYDFSWFDSNVFVSLVEVGEGSPMVLEVKMKDEKLVKAAVVGLETKYSALTVKKQVDMCPDEGGHFTLCFTDTQRKGYLATMEMFSQYGNPGISRGEARDQVFVSFLTKEEALAALLANLNNEELSLLQPAPACRLGS